jgi:carboxylesterase type B
MGTGAAFDGAVFASYTKTIVVTINYRLGPFGKKNSFTDHLQ